MFNVFSQPGKDPMKKTIAPLVDALQSGLETGDIESVSYCAVTDCVNLFLMGEPLESVEKQQSQYLDLLIKNKQSYSISYVKIWRQLSLTLLGKSSQQGSLIGENFQEFEVSPTLIKTNHQNLLFATYLVKSMLLYLFKDFSQALTTTKLAAEHTEFIEAWVTVAQHNFYYSLTLLAEYSQVEASVKTQYIHQVEKNQIKMQQWAAYASANYQHKYDLVEAEKARVSGKFLAAMDYYDRAIQGAKEQGYLQEEALANELAAEFYFSQGREKIAVIFLMDAYYGYLQWGAIAKVKDLELRYPQISSHILSRNSIAAKNKSQRTTSTTGVASLDLDTVMQASQALAEEIVLGSLLDKLLKILIKNAGAQTSCLILEKAGQMVIEATATVDQDEVVLWQSSPLNNSQELPVSLINYVTRTKKSLVLNNAAKAGNFTKDPYIVSTQPKSILCTPIINQGQVIGILYLENNLTLDAFTQERLEVVNLLSSQVAISLKNAWLYESLATANENVKQANLQLEDYSRTLEHKVEDRTLELTEKNTRLQQTLKEIEQAQSQLIQTEKMSSLGQLIAGVAHEINNPISYIYGNFSYAKKYFNELLKVIHLYQQQYPHPSAEIQEHVEIIDLDFLIKDFSKLLDSMQIGTERIRQIVLSLRNFSRLDEADMQPVDIHEEIENTLLILEHRIREKVGKSGLHIIKKYSELPLVECYPGQINQVFMNILTNALDALEDYDLHRSIDDIQQCPSSIEISTEILECMNSTTNSDSRVLIRIADNGLGMTEEVQRKLFDPFFTTKPVGSGTGLGLSISYQIVEKHGGQLKCLSAPGKGAEFIIQIPVKQQKC